MGIVFRAQQRQPSRTVALKIIRPGLVGMSTLRRFGLESDMLARLEHPGIARMYESGTLQVNGVPQPFFAMELVEGIPITEYVRNHMLGAEARVELIIKVAEAVNHAHARGIIHRDIKPANILVDDSGHPRVLDFGVARNVDASKQLQTIEGDVGQIVGTLPYMSPEQASGDHELVDVRADVYSLGVVAYEVLTGRLPLDLPPDNLLESIRTIVDTPPGLPSRYAPSCRGDLETIILKALEKEPEQRYPGALHFANDLSRFLADQPIEARPQTTLYHLRKFARRNRTLVAGSAAILMLLVAGVITISILLNRAIDAEELAVQRSDFMAEARDNAQREARNAQEITDFITEMLAAIDPAADGREWRVRDMLEIAEHELDSRFRQQPLREASIRNEMGTIYFALGMISEARTHFGRALDLRREHLGESDEDTLKCLNNLGMTFMNRDEAPQARTYLQQALDGRQAVLGPDAVETTRTRNNLASTLIMLGEIDEAERMHRENLATLTQAVGYDSDDTLTALHNLIGILRRTGRTPEAISLYDTLLSHADTVWGPSHRRTLIAKSSYASALKDLDRFDEAEQAFLESATLLREHFGPDYRDTLIVEYNLALMYLNQQRLDEAEILFASLIERARHAENPDDRFLDRFLDRHSTCLESLQRYREAATALSDRYRTAIAFRGRDSTRARRAAERLSDFYRQHGQTEQADVSNVLAAMQ